MKRFSLKKYLINTRFWQEWSYNREAQLRYLTQSAQLEEAGNPWIVRVTVVLVGAFVLLFVLWASVAQIDEVARSPGEIVPEGFQQSIQHLEGGIVTHIYVKEGDVVDVGQPLVQLSSEGLVEDKKRLELKQELLSLQEERFKAILENRDMDFDKFKNLQKMDIDSQNVIHKGVLDAQLGEEEILLKQIEQKRQDLLIVQTKLDTVQSRLKVLRDLYAKRKTLFEKGFFPQVRLLAIEDEIIVLKGEESQLKQQLTQTEHSFSETKSKLTSLSATQTEKLLNMLENIQSDLKQNKELLDKANQRMHRLVVRAPERGIVKGLNIGTIGGVVKPAQVIMEIIPLDHSLMAEIKISPKDVGNLFVGASVKIKVSAYDFSRYGSMEGTLNNLSATTFVGETGNRYYKGRVLLDKNYVGSIPGNNLIFPGMTVMADIVTGSRSVISYLFKPIQASLQSAFQEK